MRNLTISLPDEAYRQARIAAAQRDTSLSAWVRDLLLEAIDSKSDFVRRKRLQDETIASIRSFDPDNRLSREELYRR